MKRFTAKTLDDAIVLACQDYGILPDQLNYSIIEEKKGLFAKKVEIEVYVKQCEAFHQIKETVTYGS